MHSVGILPHIGFPTTTSNDDVERFLFYLDLCKDFRPEITTVLQGLLRNGNDAREISNNFRLSKYDVTAMDFLIDQRKIIPNRAEETDQSKLIRRLTYIAEHGPDSENKHAKTGSNTDYVVDTRALTIELAKLTGNSLVVDSLEKWIPVRMPLDEKDLEGLELPRKEKRKTLMHLEEKWKKSGRTLTLEELRKLAQASTKTKRLERDKEEKLTRKLPSKPWIDPKP